MRLQEAPVKKQEALSAKQNVGPAALIAAIVVVILLLTMMGWKSLGNHNDSVDQATINARIAAKRAHKPID